MIKKISIIIATAIISTHTNAQNIEPQIIEQNIEAIQETIETEVIDETMDVELVNGNIEEIQETIETEVIDETIDIQTPAEITKNEIIKGLYDISDIYLSCARIEEVDEGYIYYSFDIRMEAEYHESHDFFLVESGTRGKIDPKIIDELRNKSEKIANAVEKICKINKYEDEGNEINILTVKDPSKVVLTTVYKDKKFYTKKEFAETKENIAPGVSFRVGRTTRIQFQNHEGGDLKEDLKITEDSIREVHHANKFIIPEYIENFKYTKRLRGAEFMFYNATSNEEYDLFKTVLDRLNSFNAERTMEILADIIIYANKLPNHIMYANKPDDLNAISYKRDTDTPEIMELKKDLVTLLTSRQKIFLQDLVTYGKGKLEHTDRNLIRHIVFSCK